MKPGKSGESMGEESMGEERFITPSCSCDWTMDGEKEGQNDVGRRSLPTLETFGFEVGILVDLDLDRYIAALPNEGLRSGYDQLGIESPHLRIPPRQDSWLPIGEWNGHSDPLPPSSVRNTLRDTLQVPAFGCAEDNAPESR